MAGTKRGMPFERTGPFPIDDTFVLSKAEMAAVVDTKMPEKYFAVCKDDGKFYLYDKDATPSAETGKFAVEEGGGDVSHQEFDTLSAKVDGVDSETKANARSITSLSNDVSTNRREIESVSSEVYVLHDITDSIAQDIAKMKSDYYTNIVYQNFKWEARQLTNDLWEVLISRDFSTAGSLSMTAITVGPEYWRIGAYGNVEATLPSNQMRTLFGRNVSSIIVHNIECTFLYGENRGGVSMYATPSDFSHSANSGMHLGLRICSTGAATPSVAGSKVYVRAILTV